MATVNIAGFDFLDTGGVAAQAAFQAILAEREALTATQLSGINLALANLTGTDQAEAVAAGFVSTGFGNVTADIVREQFDIDQIWQNALVTLPSLASFSVEAIQRRRLGNLGLAGTLIRNPFRSLQAGPFAPCSSDDPRGRCLTNPVRALQNTRVVRTARGR